MGGPLCLDSRRFVARFLSLHVSQFLTIATSKWSRPPCFHFTAIKFGIKIHVFSTAHPGAPTTIAPPLSVCRMATITADACLGHYPEFHYVSTLPDSSEPLSRVRKQPADVGPARGGAVDANIVEHILHAAATHASDILPVPTHHADVPRDDTIRGAQVGSLVDGQAAGALAGALMTTGRGMPLSLASDDSASESQLKEPMQAESESEVGLTEVGKLWHVQQQRHSPAQVSDEKLGPEEPEKSKELEPGELGEAGDAHRWHAASEQTLRQLDDEEKGLLEQRRT